MYFKVIGSNFLKKGSRYDDNWGLHEVSYCIYKKTTWSKTFAKISFCFVMKLEQAAKASNQTMDAVHSHDLL